MRRDMNLIYDILSTIEESESYAPPATILADKLQDPPELIAGHIRLASDAGLLEVVLYMNELKPERIPLEKMGNVSVTMAGYDWLWEWRQSIKGKE